MQFHLYDYVMVVFNSIDFSIHYYSWWRYFWELITLKLLKHCLEVTFPLRSNLCSLEFIPLLRLILNWLALLLVFRSALTPPWQRPFSSSFDLPSLSLRHPNWKCLASGDTPLDAAFADIIRHLRDICKWRWKIFILWWSVMCMKYDCVRKWLWN